jgi:adenylate cyclase class 2
MSVEAEIKARVTDPERPNAALSRRATGERSTYHDRYFDYPDRRWTADGHELRVRTATMEDGESRVLLTFKEPVLDSDNGSEPEHETSAADAQVLVTVLTALGMKKIIACRKHCTNYAFSDRDRDLTATVVTVPELAGETFIELETTVRTRSARRGAARDPLGARRAGVKSDSYTTERCTDAVADQRNRAADQSD